MTEEARLADMIEAGRIYIEDPMSDRVGLLFLSDAERDILVKALRDRAARLMRGAVLDPTPPPRPLPSRLFR